MVLIKNIEETGNTISFDILIDGNINKTVHLVIDSNTYKLLNGVDLEMYTSMAINRIKKLKKKGDLPKETASAWY